MKRLISAVLVLLALGAAAFFFLKLRPFLPERSRAAELAPVGTIFFAQFPNLRQTALNFPQTDLYHIWREPDVQAFLERPREKVPWLREWVSLFEAATRAAPGEAFLAVTSLDGPQFVAGFAFAGSQRHAEALAEDLRTRFAPKAVSAVYRNWMLLASDAPLIEEVKARFDGRDGATLATDATFQRSTAALGPERDFVAFGRAGVLQSYFPDLGKGAARDANEVIAMATHIDGGRLHDIISFPASKGSSRAALSRQTLELAREQTLFCYVGALETLPTGLSGLRGLVPGLPAIEKSLNAKGLAWDHLPAAVGPEATAIVHWSEDAALPMLLLGAEVRDVGKARSFLEALTDPTAFDAAWRTEEHGEVQVSIAPPQAFPLVQPTLTLTDRFALLGLSSEAVVAALPRAKSNASAEKPDFSTAIQTVPPQATGLAYLDLRQLFERVYRMARPIITLSLAFSPEAGAQIDAGKLPPAESISSHLNPTVLSVTQEEDRTVVASSGSVTLPQLVIATIAATSGKDFTELSEILPGGAKAPASQQKAPKSARSPAQTR